jgi:DNA-binding NarL/FixJ family response regulator
MQIRILVADDHPFFRKGIISSLKHFDDITIVQECQNGAEVIDWIESNSNVDLLLLDFDMPKMSGIDVLQDIRSKKYPLKTIIISMHSADEIIHDIIAAGAHGYVSKDAEPEEMYNAITKVFAGEIYFNDSTNKALMNSLFIKSQISHVPVSKITFSDRELTLIKYLSQEMSNEEIAANLNLSVRTVEGIRHTLIHRTGVKTSIGLVLLVQKEGLLN